MVQPRCNARGATQRSHPAALPCGPEDGRLSAIFVHAASHDEAKPFISIIAGVRRIASYAVRSRCQAAAGDAVLPGLQHTRSSSGASVIPAKNRNAGVQLTKGTNKTLLLYSLCKHCNLACNCRGLKATSVFDTSWLKDQQHNVNIAGQQL